MIKQKHLPIIIIILLVLFICFGVTGFMLGKMKGEHGQLEDLKLLVSTMDYESSNNREITKNKIKEIESAVNFLESVVKTKESTTEAPTEVPTTVVTTETTVAIATNETGSTTVVNASDVKEIPTLAVAVSSNEEFYRLIDENLQNKGINLIYNNDDVQKSISEAVIKAMSNTQSGLDELRISGAITSIKGLENTKVITLMKGENYVFSSSDVEAVTEDLFLVGLSGEYRATRIVASRQDGTAFILAIQGE